MYKLECIFLKVRFEIEGMCYLEVTNGFFKHIFKLFSSVYYIICFTFYLFFPTPLFIKNFAEDDKRKTMKYLKPTQRTESHALTFFIGFFAGFFLALFV
ncbi:hypothetical protein ACS0TY_020253 [Phlomoides rotata]